MLHPLVGGMPVDEAWKSVQLLTDTVLPALSLTGAAAGQSLMPGSAVRQTPAAAPAASRCPPAGEG